MFIKLLNENNDYFIINANDIQSVHELKAECLNDYLTLYNKSGNAKCVINMKNKKEFYTQATMDELLNILNGLGDNTFLKNFGMEN